MKAIYAAPFAIALLAGCSAAPKSFDIDNPTASNITVELDGSTHQVPAGGSVAVSLQAGAHTLRAPGLGDINFVVSRQDQGGLINPTRSDYVIARSIDPAHAPQLRRFDHAEDGATVDGTLYEGPYRASNEVVIARSWRAGVHDAPPAARTGVDPALADAKIFAASDFVSFYRDTVEGPSTYAYVVNPMMPAPSYLTTLDNAQLPSLPPLFAGHAGELREVYTAYLDSIDPAPALQRDAGTRLVYLQPSRSTRAIQ